MRLRTVVAIAVLAMLTTLVGSTTVATNANASNLHVLNNVGFEFQAPHVAGVSVALPISTSSLRGASLFAVLVYVAMLLFLVASLATDASLRMPAFGFVGSARRRRAPPLLLV